VKHHDVIIIGAGAAGLMCAATAGYRGRDVLVLDNAKQAGKKFLSVVAGVAISLTKKWSRTSSSVAIRTLLNRH